VKEEKKDNLHEIHSPIVGTFYRAPAPDADPYVQVGDSISSGSVLCIVEAMKLMNEIESDVNGKIVKILVENGKPVEYNQPLFLIQLS
jgi:acetyl-CoA carboxylase biotin carboxyl carrier protein